MPSGYTVERFQPVGITHEQQEKDGIGDGEEISVYRPISSMTVPFRSNVQVAAN